MEINLIIEPMQFPQLIVLCRSHRKPTKSVQLSESFK